MLGRTPVIYLEVIRMPALTPLEIEILKKIKPTEDEYKEINNAYSILKNLLDERLTAHRIEADVSIQGSIAHDTWLSGDRDIDVFILFPENWSREDLETRGLGIILEVARTVGKYELRYAEHPYVRIWIGDVAADVVPALKISDPSRIKSAVDRTPYHTRFVNSKLTDELRDHVRLLKRFMKTIGVYGAEVKTRGFSGYVAELLIIKYGGFREVLEEASKWTIPVFINTVESKPDREVFKLLQSRYPDSVIYMPDPVDPARNVTASVGRRSLLTFILASRCYLDNPSEVFFEEPLQLSIDDILAKSARRCIVFLEYNLRDQLPPDVIWGEAWRTASTIGRILRNFDITVMDYSAWTNEKDVVLIGLELAECTLSTYKLYPGPCLGDPYERIDSFIQRHRDSSICLWIDNDGCLKALEPRKVTNSLDIIEERWLEYSVSPHLRTVKPVVRTTRPEDIRYLVDLGAGKWLSRFLVKTPTWMEKCTSSRD